MRHRFWAVALCTLALTALAQPAATDPDEGDLPDDDSAFDAGEGALTDVVQAPAARTRSSSRRGGADELTDEQAGALGLASLCCCFVGVAGLVALIVWAVRRSSKPAAAGPVQPGYAPPQAVTQPPGMQLSIFALGLEPQARDVVEQQLAQQGISPVPTSPENRGRLVREAARALLTVQPSWRQFGYGEKPGLADLAAAEGSYRAASDDFRARASSVGATAPPTGGLVVVTLLVCSRRPLIGVSRLDESLQVRTLLEDRMRVGDLDLLGAELLWSPAAPGGRVSEAEIGLRFPEMQPLTGRSI